MKKEDAPPCCRAKALPDGRLPIGFCDWDGPPVCSRRVARSNGTLFTELEMARIRRIQQEAPHAD